MNIFKKLYDIFRTTPKEYYYVLSEKQILTFLSDLMTTDEVVPVTGGHVWHIDIELNNKIKKNISNLLGTKCVYVNFPEFAFIVARYPQHIELEKCIEFKCRVIDYRADTHYIFKQSKLQELLEFYK